MRSSAIVLLVLAAAPAAADPITAKLGKKKVTLTPCTIEGPALVLGGDVESALAIAPDGALVLLDGHGDLHRYVVASDKGCTLTPDTHFGKDGVLATGLLAKYDASSVTIDRAGTIYAENWLIADTSARVRVVGGKLASGCGEESVAASPRSPHVWRWRYLTHVTRGDGCDDGDPLDLSGPDHDVSGAITALDDRMLLARDLRTDQILDASGRVIRTLQKPELVSLVRAWAPCGDAICGAGQYEFYAWGKDGKLIGSFDTQGLSQSEKTWTPSGFQTDGKTGWLLGDEYMDGAPRRPAIILRVDGLPSRP